MQMSPTKLPCEELIMRRSHSLLCLSLSFSLSLSPSICLRCPLTALLWAVTFCQCCQHEIPSRSVINFDNSAKLCDSQSVPIRCPSVLQSSAPAAFFLSCADVLQGRHLRSRFVKLIKQKCKQSTNNFPARAPKSNLNEFLNSFWFQRGHSSSCTGQNWSVVAA